MVGGMSKSILEALKESPLLCDGGMGTQLIARGMSPGECGMLWNVDRPNDIADVHRAYFDAGCRLLTTNSFGGSRSMLDRHGHGGRVAELSRAAAEIARSVAGADGWVLGDVGPFGDFLEPMGETEEDELLEIFGEQITALVEGGADAVLVETMSDPSEVAVGVRAAQSRSDLPVIVTYAFQKSADTFRTMMGTTVADALGRALGEGASVVGANCGTDLSLDDYRVLAAELVEVAGDAPVILQPNAGAPRTTPDGVVYDATPEEMAEAAEAILAKGVRILGGCCGTTPAHLQAMGGKV